MVILATSLVVFKYLLKTIVSFYFLQVIKIPINHQSYYLLYFVYVSGYFSLFCLSIIEYLIS